jgi:hypothetical protein
LGGASQATGSGWCCKRWAGPFPWFESYLNQTNHAQNPLCHPWAGLATGWQHCRGTDPELARHGLQQLIELEFAAVIGADRHERTEERHGYRNGDR